MKVRTIREIFVRINPQTPLSRADRKAAFVGQLNLLAQRANHGLPVLSSDLFRAASYADDVEQYDGESQCLPE